MEGFTDKALVLLPKKESVEQRGYEYNANLKLALTNLLKYLESVSIEPHIFYTDDVAREMLQPCMRIVSPLCKADAFFASRYCSGMSDSLRLPMITHDNLYNLAMKKYPTMNGLTVEQNFVEVLKRTNYVTKEIIKTYKLVCNFVRKGNPNFKVTSKQNDGKVLIEIDAVSFLPTAFMSGTQVDPCSLLAIPYGNRSLLVWGNP